MADRTDVVTSFIERDGEILLMKRSQDVRTYRGHWAGISGYLETEDPLNQAKTEIREETGLNLNQVKLVKQGEPLSVDDNDHHWRIHPFRFQANKDITILLDREHTKSQWTDPEKLDKLQTVPALKTAWERVL